MWYGLISWMEMLPFRLRVPLSYMGSWLELWRNRINWIYWILIKIKIKLGKLEDPWFHIRGIGWLRMMAGNKMEIFDFNWRIWTIFLLWFYYMICVKVAVYYLGVFFVVGFKLGQNIYKTDCYFYGGGYMLIINWWDCKFMDWLCA